MIKKLTYKKEYWLPVGTVLLLLASYQLALKNTIEAWQLNHHLVQNLNQVSNSSAQPGYIQRKSYNLDQIIGIYSTDTLAFRNNVINKIATIAEKVNVKLSEVPVQDPLNQTNEFVIQKIEFEGDFFSLLKMLNNIASSRGIGVPRSVMIKTVETRTKDKVDSHLVLDVYLETTK